MVIPSRSRLQLLIYRLRPRSHLRATARCCQRSECGLLRLASPSDPLTRLLMDADGVSEAAMEELLQKLADILASRQPCGPRR